MGAVATNDPRRFYRLFAPIGVTQNGAHGVAYLGQARQLDPALHGNPERVEMFAEQTLGLGLRQSQSERERARDGSELDSGDLLETMMKGEPVESMAGCDEVIGDPHCLKNFKSARENRQRLGGLRRLGGAVNNAATHAVPGEFIGHR